MPGWRPPWPASIRWQHERPRPPAAGAPGRRGRCRPGPRYLVRVTWSATWSSYLVTVTRPGRGIVAEHVVPDRARALDLADSALDDLAALAGMPA